MIFLRIKTPDRVKRFIQSFVILSKSNQPQSSKNQTQLSKMAARFMLIAVAVCAFVALSEAQAPGGSAPGAGQIPIPSQGAPDCAAIKKACDEQAANPSYKPLTGYAPSQLTGQLNCENYQQYCPNVPTTAAPAK